MAKVEVLFGDFTFEEPRGFSERNPPVEKCMRPPYLLNGKFTATVNRVDAVMYVEESELDEVCENGLETYESYLIPDLYKKYGEIIGNTLFPNHHIKRH